MGPLVDLALMLTGRRRSAGVFGTRSRGGMFGRPAARRSSNPLVGLLGGLVLSRVLGGSSRGRSRRGGALGAGLLGLGLNALLNGSGRSARRGRFGR